MYVNYIFQKVKKAHDYLEAEEAILHTINKSIPNILINNFLETVDQWQLYIILKTVIFYSKYNWKALKGICIFNMVIALAVVHFTESQCSLGSK